MKITYAKKTATVCFDKIKVGQCFIHDGFTYLKINCYFGCENAFSFEDNMVCQFFPHSDAIPVEVELIVHAEER